MRSWFCGCYVLFFNAFNERAQIRQIYAGKIHSAHTYNTVMIGMTEETAKGNASRHSKQLKERDRERDCTQCPNDTNHRKKLHSDTLMKWNVMYVWNASECRCFPTCDVVWMCVCVCRVYFTFDLVHCSTGRFQTLFQRVCSFMYAWVCK